MALHILYVFQVEDDHEHSVGLVGAAVGLRPSLVVPFFFHSSSFLFQFLLFVLTFEISFDLK